MGATEWVQAKKAIKSLELFSWLPSHQRLDVWPFVIAYLVPPALYLARVLPAHETMLCWSAVVALHVLSQLLQFWSVRARTFIACRRASTPQAADVAVVTPPPYCGPTELVPMLRAAVETDAAAAGVASTELSFTYRQQRFIFEARDGLFKKVAFHTREPLVTYLRATGYGTPAAAAAALSKWGPNRFAVPLPSFGELMQEHMLAPFFVFQIFCVGLWFLDEYWYYSLFTLFMLLLFEAVVVLSRMRTYGELRRIGADAMALPALRGGRWETVAGSALLPGDLVALSRPTGTGAEEAVVPADMLLLAGTAIVNEAMLTGESTPQWKRPAGERGDPTGALAVKRDRLHVVFGGTKILQHAPTADEDAPGAPAPVAGSPLVVAGSPLSVVPRVRPPDGACLAVVLRTGFGTAQGKLMRTLLFSQERVTANNWESGLFILFLLFFALLAAGYVLLAGLRDPTRNRYKLYLECALIITSVIPPELPMELSIAVNTSLIALARLGVYCTEPFRIPFAGKVDVCCFDKTGTLTADNMVFQGVTGLPARAASHTSTVDASAVDPTPAPRTAGNVPAAVTTDLVASASLLPAGARYTLAACHALVVLDGKLVGDPLERAALHGSGWSYAGHDVATLAVSAHPGTVVKAGGSPPVATSLRILARHHFSSALRRMAVVARSHHHVGSDSPQDALWVLAKGAPESMETLLAEVPPGYTAAHRRYATQGARVLALAWRKLDAADVGASSAESALGAAIKALPRSQLEHRLTFGGFLVLSCPLKPESAPTMAALAASSHALVMITGDAALTAVHAAGLVQIMTRPPLILSALLPAGVHASEPTFEWVSPDGVIRSPFVDGAAGAMALGSVHDLCVSGDGLSWLHRTGRLAALLPHVQVYARASPEQKGVVVMALRDAGHAVLMCGDGTNDVGALKAAHVGVALLSGPPGGLPGPRARPIAPPQPGVGAAALAAARAAAVARGADPSVAAAQLVANAARASAAQAALAATLSGGGDGESTGVENRAPLVKLGDASMASPFTARGAGVLPCVYILRQGRCTLVTTLQMFKILGLNCLATAYVLSVQYLDGVKLGDTQAVVSGMLTAGLFLCLSRAQPLEKLSKQRPHPSIFCAYVFLSVMAQFGCHLALLISLVRLAEGMMPPELAAGVRSPESKFSANPVNTVSYLVNLYIQSATFGVNYMGYPVNQPLRENKALANTLAVCATAFLTLTLDCVPGLNGYLELVHLPWRFRAWILACAAADLAVCSTVEHGLRWLLPAPSTAGIRAAKGKGARGG